MKHLLLITTALGIVIFLQSCALFSTQNKTYYPPRPDVPVEDPIIDESPLPQEVCIVDGNVLQVGQTFEDDCNLCTCMPGGEISCTDSICDDIDSGEEAIEDFQSRVIAKL